MGRMLIFLALLLVAFGYTSLVYFKGAPANSNAAVLLKQDQKQILEGKKLFQQYNCIACHQIYGLGGYIGPDLTTAWSDKHRGEAYMRAMLLSGGSRMPNFHFTPPQVEALLSYLRYVDTTATIQSTKFSRK